MFVNFSLYNKNLNLNVCMIKKAGAKCKKKKDVLLLISYTTRFGATVKQRVRIML